MNLIEAFREMKVIPVIRLEDPELSEDLIDALAEGGLPAAEVTFRTDAAAETIRRMRERRPDALVGAGTVLTIGQAQAAMDAGAKFIVSPGLNPKIVRHCQEQNMPVCPGVATASEIEQAMELGIYAVKFFPAGQMGGLKTIQALAAPYHMMQFMPTGGVNPQNAPEYLAYEKIFAVGGSWIAPDALLKEKNFAAIRRNAEEASRFQTDFEKWIQS